MLKKIEAGHTGGPAGRVDERDDREKIAAMREVDEAKGQSGGSRAQNGARPVSFRDGASAAAD
jgi:hypothetical protein